MRSWVNKPYRHFTPFTKCSAAKIKNLNDNRTYSTVKSTSNNKSLPKNKAT